MDDYERTVRRVRTEEVIPTEPVVPVAPVEPEPVYAAQPVYEAQPVYQTPPVYQAPPVVAAAPVRPMGADRIVTERQTVRTTPSAIEMTRRIVGLLFGILQALLLIRLVLLLLVANRENDVVQFILGVTAPFVNPFRDMFALNQIGSSGSVLDIAAIVALIAWTLVELLVFAILNLGGGRRTATY